MSADFADVLDALRDLWTAALLADPATESVPVREAGEATYGPAEYLQVGSTGPDPGEGVEITPVRAGLGRQPSHQVRVPCLAWVGSGTPDPKMLRDQANAIYGAAAQALRTREGRNLGGLVDTADIVSASYRHFAFERGAGAGIQFVVEVNAL